MTSSRRILVNTCAQYVRTIVCMILSFWATRIVLNTMGVEDYGIFTVVAGVVSILSFLTNSLVITSQRFLSVSQGEGNLSIIRSLFNNCIYLHIFIALGVFVLLQLLALPFFDGMLNIPENKIASAKLLYQFVAVTLCLTFLSSPFRAVIISHENIVFISLLEIVDAILKTIIAYILLIVEDGRIHIYGALLMTVQLFNLVAVIIFSYSRYPECGKLQASDWSWHRIKELFSFAGWTMYNLVCNLGRTQGIAVGLNRTMGPVVNSAYGLAFQVSSALSSVSQSLLNAINPQLMKREGAGNRESMLRLAAVESKLSFFLLSAVAVPSIFEMPNLLSLWLGESHVPEYAVLFCRMVILASLADTLTTGLGSANQAVGDIRLYTLVIYTTKLLTLPFALWILYTRVSLVWLVVIYAGLEFLSSIMRIPFLSYTAGLDVGKFCSSVFQKEIVPIVVLSLVCLLSITIFDFQFRFVLTFLFSILIYAIAIYWIGLCDDEKGTLKQCLSFLRHKLQKNCN